MGQRSECMARNVEIAGKREETLQELFKPNTQWPRQQTTDNLKAPGQQKKALPGEDRPQNRED